MFNSAILLALIALAKIGIAIVLLRVLWQDYKWRRSQLEQEDETVNLNNGNDESRSQP